MSALLTIQITPEQLALYVTETRSRDSTQPWKPTKLVRRLLLIFAKQRKSSGPQDPSSYLHSAQATLRQLQSWKRIGAEVQETADSATKAYEVAISRFGFYEVKDPETFEEKNEECHRCRYIWHLWHYLCSTRLGSVCSAQCEADWA